MKIKFFLLFISLCFFTFSIKSQNNFKVLVKDSVTHEVLIGVSATIENTAISAVSNADGEIIFNKISDGKQQLLFYFIGYKKFTKTISFPTNEKSATIYLVPTENNLDEVIVSTTRSNSRIDDLPTKVEVLGQEDMDEESTIVPGNVSSILGDLSIITIQRTNPVNGNDAIRMQGLDSKYTQLMRDGLPLYGGFSGSLGVLAIPPLDLKQVEIIKGSASTLYGGGAIGGLINFISKTPNDSTEATIILNATSLGEGNVNAFVSGKTKKIGATLFVGANVKQAVDVNNDGFSDVPFDQNYSIHPRLFFDITKKTQLIIGLNSNYDNRIGGDIKAIKNGTDSIHSFLHQENVFRNSVDFTLTSTINDANTLTVKTAGSSFQRNLDYSGFVFDGTQYSSYSEINDAIKFKKHTIVGGLNFISENFVMNKSDAILFSSYNYTTTGIFLQDDWQAFQKLSFQIGMRYDYHNVFGSFALPRLSLFYKASPKFSIRLAGGSGYKTPNLFDLTEPSPIITNVSATVHPENSYGANADINYHTFVFNDLNITINQAFYYTTITNSIVLNYNTYNYLTATNGNYQVNSYGTDTYIRLKYNELELYLGYNHTEALQQYTTINFNMPFNPKDKFSSTLAYDIEGKWRMGIEAAYTANQYIYNNKKVNDFWFVAAMIERKFKFLSIVINCENLLDTKQSNYEKIVEGTKQNPIFKPLWAPTEGRVLNLSLKIKI